MNTPSASIVMPVYNAEKFLSATLKSVRAQTFKDFELILVDDGSSDGSVRIAEKFAEKHKDMRIRIISHGVNKGVAAATNTGLDAATGTYIVMMDHDDMSMPDRVERQVGFLEAHTEFDGCGGRHIKLSRSLLLDKLNARRLKMTGIFIPPEQVKCETLWGGCIFNPTVCFRRRCLDRTGLRWNTAYSTGADDEFYGRFLDAGVKMCILPYAVLRYRRHRGSLSLKSREKSAESRTAIALAGLERLYPEASVMQKKLHASVVTRDRSLSIDDLPHIQTFWRSLIRANRTKRMYDEESMKKVMARHWSRVCALAGCEHLKAAWRAYYGFEELREYLGSPLFLLYQWQKRRFRKLSGQH